MKSIIEDFEEAQEATDDKIAAAILVLSKAIRDKRTIDVASGENFGHELALALKNALSESVVRAEVTTIQG